ncbi:nuclear transport factor 2 family protein [Planctomonas sp. JC2975]|uniref:nuclear transport factor 2 family protein n=1 Tax=Planctomonas sp. JC2975 TaxID=2729626 RepID=UPI001475B232|nr:nuclear transport factor 2 family protein [Planctomonas sp. JC2975]NNC13803.1 nuclear transport factor 2 family protein [Planctomonas sp. JC2975]
MSTTSLTGVLAENIRATNAGDLDAILATFADDAFVTDASREFRGKQAIRAFLSKEIVGDRVSYEVVEVLGGHGQTIVRTITDGLFDKSRLPSPLILTHYFQITEGKIASQITILLKDPAR